jgi:uncharacterized protein with FMN-binding domain
MRNKVKTWFKRVVASALIAGLALSLPALAGRSGMATAAGDDAALSFASSKNYGSGLDDAFKGVARTDDGGFVAAGYSMARNPDLPGWENVRNDSGYAYNDGIVVKFAEDMHVEWAKSYGNTQTDTLFGVDVLKNGTIVAAGTSTYSMPEGSGNSATVSGYILLIDPDDPEDFRELHVGGSKGDQLQAVTATSDGGFVVAGFTASTDSAEWRETKKSGTTDGAVAKYNAEGELVFSNTYNIGIDLGLESLRRTRFFGIAEDGEGNLFAVGDVQVAANLYNSAAVKIDGKTGEQLWSKSIGTTLTAAPRDGADYHTSCLVGAAVLTDGSYVAVGTTRADADTPEDWTSVGSIDGVIVRYASDGTLLNSVDIGTIDRTAAKNGSVDFTGVLPLPDGGYIVYGSTNQIVYEETGRAAGYTWSNYGQHDILLLRYDSENELQWTENYGGENGDYVNDMLLTGEGEYIAVGEATGISEGSIKYNNVGKVDALLLTTGYHEAAQSEMGTPDSANVVWADGEYEDQGNGYGGAIRVKVTVADGRIASVEEISQSETRSYYRRAMALYDTIVEAQTANVDSVSGATMSSNGIKRASSNALSQSAAKHVVDVIDGLGEGTEESREAVWAARRAYEELGTYARGFVTNLDKLEAAEAVTGREDTAAGEDTGSQEEPGDAAGNDPASETSPYAASDTYYGLQDAYMSGINWEAFRQNGITGEGSVIAVLDSGLTGSHADLDYDYIREGKDLIGKAEMIDTNGHGTAVTGIIQAISDNGIGVSGLLSKAEIIPVRVGTGSTNVKAADLAEGIRYAVDEGAQVITMSIGLRENAAGLDMLEEAVKYAYEKGVILIAAAGNSGNAESTDDPPLYPASYDEVIGVGGLLQDNTVRPSSQKNESVFVTAPGTDMVLLDLSRRTKCKISSGTSYSAPVVAAMAAAAKAETPDMTPGEFKEILRSTVMDAGDTGYDTSYGWGIVDLEAFAKVIRADNRVKAADVKAVPTSYNDTVTVEIPVSITGNKGVSAITTVFSGVDFTGAEVTANYGSVVYNNLGEDLKVEWWDQSAPETDGVMFTISLEYENGTVRSGMYPVTVTVSDPRDGNIEITQVLGVNGSVTIRNYFIPGDVNMDGVVNNADLILMARDVVEIIRFTDFQKEIGDMNGDEEISNADIITVARMLVGLPPEG